MMTPRCTIIPPLVRPMKPRTPWRRVARITWRSAEPAANPASPKHTSCASPRACTATATSTQNVPNHAGHCNRCTSVSTFVFRHGRTGAAPPHPLPRRLAVRLPPRKTRRNRHEQQQAEAEDHPEQVEPRPPHREALAVDRLHDERPHRPEQDGEREHREEQVVEQE